MTLPNTKVGSVENKDDITLPQHIQPVSPLSRLLYTVILCLWLSQGLIFLLILPGLMYYSFWAFSWTRLPILLYFTWFILDRKGPAYIRYSDLSLGILRFNPMFKYVQKYFSGRLVKTAHVDPKRKYIMTAHPHGLYGVNLLSNILFNRDFAVLFPGLQVSPITLGVNFYLPIWREYLMLMAVCSADKHALMNRLSKGPDGTCILLLVGGTEEAGLAEPGTMDVVIKKRKGFVKIALQTGASILPTLGFGENETFTIVKSKWAEPIRILFRRMFGTLSPLFWGNNYGFPGTGPLTTVVGKPIYVDKIENPTDNDIEALHSLYMKEVVALYDRYKDVYHTDRTRELRIIA